MGLIQMCKQNEHCNAGRLPDFLGKLAGIAIALFNAINA
jgi:hypothetical protein